MQDAINKSINISGGINTTFLRKLGHVPVLSVIFRCKKIKIAWHLSGNALGSFLTLAWPEHAVATQILGFDNIHDALAAVQPKSFLQNLFERCRMLAKLPTILLPPKTQPRFEREQVFTSS